VSQWLHHGLHRIYVYSHQLATFANHNDFSIPSGTHTTDWCSNAFE